MTVTEIYAGSDGEATKGLYQALEAHGPIGVVAVNLFRAHKASARAKVYRGGIRGQGAYSRLAYERKDWALANLTTTLTHHAAPLGLRWGWAADPEAAVYRAVLYVDLPTGQVSFHTGHRGVGPDYAEPWDGVRDVGAARICGWIDGLLQAAAPVLTEAHG